MSFLGPTLFGVNFSQIQNAPVLLAWLVLLFFMWRSASIRRKILDALRVTQLKGAFEAPVNRGLKNVLFAAGVFFACIAWLGPQWGQKEQITKTQGLDICIALDISRSMLAEDLSPSRLKQAKNQLNLFLPRLGGDRVAVVGFAGSSFIASPLSVDYQSVLNFVEAVDPSFQSDHSTNIPQAIETCLSALGLEDVYDRNKISDDASKVILFVSDGEDTVEGSKDIAKRALKLGVTIYSMMVGTTKGGPIPLRDENGRTTGYIKDPATNQPAISKIQDKLLKALASDSGGKVFYMSEGPSAWASFENEISGLKRDSREAGKRVDKEERYQWPLLVAFILLLLDFLLTETKFRFRMSSLFLIGIAIATHSAQASTLETIYRNNRAVKEFSKEKKSQAFDEAIASDPTDPQLRYNWSTSRLKQAYERSQQKEQPEESLKQNEVLANQALSELSKLKSEPKAQSVLSEKKLLHQSAQAHEIKRDLKNALSDYYQSLLANEASPESQKIDEASRSNITRLITENSSSSQGNSSQQQQDPNGDQGSGQDSSGEGDKGKNNPAPKDGADAPQGRQKPKFSGSEISEAQARQIMQSVSGEEQEVIRRKFEDEAKQRQKRASEDGIEGQGKPW